MATETTAQIAAAMRPLINAKVADKVRAHVDDAVAQGVRLLFGGRARPGLGSQLFFEPSVVRDVIPDMRLCRGGNEIDGRLAVYGRTWLA